LLHNIANVASSSETSEHGQGASEDDFVEMIGMSARFKKSQHAAKVLVYRVLPIRFRPRAHH
jgi:hypothetical protein